MDGDVRRPSVVVAGKTNDARNEKTRGEGMEGDRRRVGRWSRRTPIASGRREPQRRPSETRVPNRAARGGVTKAHGPRGRRRPKAETSWKPAGQRARDPKQTRRVDDLNGERHRRAKPNVATRARERRRTPRGDVPASRVFARRARLGASRGRAREPERPGRRPGVRPPRIARANLRLESHRGQ